MALSNSQWLANPDTGYEIDQSIRFNDGDSAYLSRTPSSGGNQRTWTFSAWVKRCALTLGGSNHQTLFSCGTENSQIRFHATGDTLNVLFGGSTDGILVTNQVFRDVAAWYHIVVAVDTTQSTASDRCKVYVNGSQVTSFSTETYPAEDYDSGFNNTEAHNIGRSAYDSDRFFDGYLAEIHWIDGTAKAASHFGETNGDTGQWVPKRYTGGGYGTNGFYLKGQDSSALGDDSSGNGNDYSSSGLAAADQMSDSPTDNHCVLNALDGAGTLSDGNLVNAATTSSFVSRRATIGIPSSGKWAFRVKKSANNFMVGVMAPQATDGDPDTNGVDAVFYYDEDGTSSGDIQTRRSGSKVVEATDAPAGIAADTFMEVLIDKDNNRLGVVIGGTAYIAVDSGVAIQDTMTQIFVSTEGSGVTATVDFGQSGFTPSQTGYKALSTANLPDPAIADPSAHFQTTLYTGNGSTQSINQSGNSTFQPDWVWIKNRDATDSHVLTDAVRGATKILSSDTTDAESTDADTLTAFESDGFALGDDDKVNTNTEKFVAWQWKANGSGSSNEDGSINTTATSANTTAGFSIIEWTGTAANGTIGHGLGVQPSLYILKNTATTNSWLVGSTVYAATAYLSIGNTDALATGDTAVFNSTHPTSSVINLGSNVGTNGASGTGNMICYAFAEVEGFSKISSFEGNTSTDGSFVYTGFRPAFVLVKNIDAVTVWPIQDTARSPFNLANAQVFTDRTTAETTGYQIDILSNGFKARSADTGINGATMVYLAIAETPFKTATAR